MSELVMRYPSDMEEVLERAQYGVLATVDAKGWPYLTPVNFLYCEGNIYFHCALSGRKLSNIDTNPRVCFNVHEVISVTPEGEHLSGCEVRYRSVNCTGTARLVPEYSEKRKWLHRFAQKFEPDREPPDDQAIKKTGLVEIVVSDMTGKHNLPS